MLLLLSVFASDGALSNAPSVLNQLHLVLGAANIPHPAKADKGGEDAFFFDDSLGTFGLADGVGGSASDTVDPGAFSREMLRRCHKAACSDGEVVTVTDVLREASKEPMDLGGSATLLLGQLECGTNTLRLVNHGDSGAILLRPSVRRFRNMRNQQVLYPRCVLRSQDQTHFFVSIARTLNRERPTRTPHFFVLLCFCAHTHGAFVSDSLPAARYRTARTRCVPTASAPWAGVSRWMRSLQWSKKETC